VETSQLKVNSRGKQARGKSKINLKERTSLLCKLAQDPPETSSEESQAGGFGVASVMGWL
jgi:hypothetical protein